MAILMRYGCPISILRQFSLGKTLALFVQIGILELVIGPAILILYETQVSDWLLCFSLQLPEPAFAVCGVLWGVMASGLRVRTTLLPLLLVPVLSPVLLAGSRAFETALGVRAGDGWTWTGLMFVIASLHTAVDWERSDFCWRRDNDVSERSLCENDCDAVYPRFRVLALAAVAVMALLGLVVSPPDVVQGEAVRMLYLHVPAIWIAYGSFAVTSVSSLLF